MKGFEFKYTPGAVDGFSTEPFQKKKDAMLSDFYSSLNRTPKKAFKKKMEEMEEVPKTRGKRGYPTGKGR